jgi:Spy/CpxP family protein refolding chaperone
MPNKLIKLTLAFAFAIFACGAITMAQTPAANDRQTDAQQGDRRPNLLRELGLSQDQIRQVRLLNADIRPRRQAAQQRLREANRSLDQAIYADAVDEALVAERLREYQAAQADVAAINFENELSIRKILTPEQLVKFRTLRLRFREAREAAQRRRAERIRQRQNRRPGNETPDRPNPRQRP